MTIFSTTGSQLFVGPAEDSDCTLADYQALDAGAAASGTFTFSGQPGDTTTITINTIPVEFVTTPATGKVTIGADLPTTLGHLLTFLTGSSDSHLTACTYASDGASVLTVTAATGGAAGNAIPLAAATGSNASVSHATLQNGTDSAWVEVGEISNLGAFGDTSSAITFSSIADGRVRKMKGARDAGSISLVCGFDARDPGQLALSAAETTKYYYAFKVIASDKRLDTDTPTIFYFNALVDSEKTTFGANNAVVQTTFTLNVNSAILDVPSAAAA